MSSLLLAGGYQLAWNVFGEEDGLPVFYFHGAPGSGIEPELASDILKELRIRLIAPERPGYGQSTTQRHFTLESWAKAVRQLSHHLRLQEYSVLGYSAGGPYAMACGHYLADSVKSITVVSSLAPFDSVAMQNHINAEFKFLYELCASDFEYGKARIGQLANSPEALYEIMKASAATTDQSIFALDSFCRSYTKNMRMALACGIDGIANDLRNLALPWRFKLEQIGCHVNVWHGNEDANVGIAVGEHLAKHLGNVSTFYLDKAGHFFLFEKWRDVLKQHIDRVGDL